MTVGLSRCIGTLLICVMLLPVHAEVEPRPHAAFEGVGLGAKAALVVAAVVAAAALIGVGVYFAVRQGRTASGCVADSGGGLQLENSNSQTWLLLGNTASIKPGERVRVSGSRKKHIKGVSERPSFVVEKVKKDYGPCPVAPAHP